MFYHGCRRRRAPEPRPFPVVAWLLAFCLGTALVAVSPYLPALWLPLLLLPLCAAVARPLGGLLAALLLGIVWGVASGQRLLAQWLPPDCERLPVTLQGHVASLPEVSVAFGDRQVQRFLLDVSSLSPAACAGPRRVRLSYYGDSAIEPGQYGEFNALLRVPWGLANPGQPSRESWYAVNGIHATGSVRHLVLDDGRNIPWRYRHHVARVALLRSLDAVPGDPRSKGLLAALTVGARQRLAPQDWTLLKELGVVHLAVISGLHVGLASGVGALLGQALARVASLVHAGAPWRQLPGMMALLCASSYAALAGFSLPTVRALTMLAGALVALALRRDPVSPDTLILAMFVLVLIQPLATASSGLWLSVGAVAALLWFIAWQPRQPPLTLALRMHGYLCVAMLPLTAWWFGGGSVVAPLANAVAVPVVGLLVVPMTLLASLADTLSDSLARWLWQWPLLLLQLLLGLADSLAALAGGLRYRPLVAETYAAVNALLAVTLLGLPLPWRLRLPVAGLLLPLLLREPAAVSGRPELTVLDVGQGTAVVVTAGPRALVYDTGGGQPGAYTAAAAALIPFLQQRGVDVIDTLVVSHADRDHSAGVQALLEAMPVTRLLYGQVPDGVTRGSLCRTGAAWAWPGEVRFQVLAGPAGAGNRSNDASCVLLVDLAGHRFLLPGDISAGRERDLVEYWRGGLQSDWLLAAHHGSGGSTASAWLRAVDPVGVILNHGRANPFGHPHPDVMERLARRGIDTRATAREGAIVFRVAADGRLEVTTSRGGHSPFWLPPG